MNGGWTPKKPSVLQEPSALEDVADLWPNAGNPIFDKLNGKRKRWDKCNEGMRVDCLRAKEDFQLWNLGFRELVFGHYGVRSRDA